MHRWPILLPSTEQHRRASIASLGRKRGKSMSGITSQTTGPSPPTRPKADSLRARERAPDVQPTIASVGAELVPATSTATMATTATRMPLRRASAAESSLEILRNQDGRKPLHNRAYQTMSRLYGRAEARGPGKQVGPQSRQTARDVASSSPDAPDARGLASATGNSDILESEQSSGGKSNFLGVARARVPREPSAPHGLLQGPAQFPPELLPLLDGEHHTDEICTRFEIGWPVLRQWLFAAGGAQEGDEEYGNISIIYR